MAHPNEELIRGGYEAFATGDVGEVLRRFADDITWHIPGRGALSGDYRGHEEVMGFFGKLMELSGGTFKLEVHDLLANDEHGVALVTGTATRDGKSFTGIDVHVFHFRDGKVVEFWDSPVDQYASDEFWG